jgi:hypothetical protein
MHQDKGILPLEGVDLKLWHVDFIGGLYHFLHIYI